MKHEATERAQCVPKCTGGRFEPKPHRGKKGMGSETVDVTRIKIIIMRFMKSQKSLVLLVQ